jgi:hypothetical protein
MAVSYIPLINNLPNPLYNGLSVKLGETPSHFAKRPTLTKINGKNKIVVICIGASTPGQISTQLELLGNTLKDVKIINCCTGAMDINDWNIESGIAWSNLEDDLVKNGYDFIDVQGIIMCHDDLKSQSNTFPSAPRALTNLMKTFIGLAKSKFINLKQIDLFTRLCEYKITDTKFGTPSGYHNGWSNKFLVEDAIAAGGFLNGVWITDATGYLWTDGETVRSDSFSFKFSWMKQRQTSVHLDTRLEGDNICANHIFNNCKRYSWFK